MEKLREFMKGRPFDKEACFEDAVIEYIKQVELASLERYDTQQSKGA